MKNLIKEEFRNTFSNKVILKTLWRNRFIFISLNIGFISRSLVENEVLGLISTLIIAVTVLFALTFMDYKLSKSRFGKYFKYREDE